MQGFPGGASGKEPARQCRRLKSCGFDSWAWKIPGGGHGNSLQYSCLGNPVDRGAWWATVHGVTKRWTRLNAHSTDTPVLHQSSLPPSWGSSRLRNTKNHVNTQPFWTRQHPHVVLSVSVCVTLL